MCLCVDSVHVRICVFVCPLNLGGLYILKYMTFSANGGKGCRHACLCLLTKKQHLCLILLFVASYLDMRCSPPITHSPNITESNSHQPDAARILLVSLYAIKLL